MTYRASLPTEVAPVKLVTILWLLLLASPAWAQNGTLRMRWSACPGDPASVASTLFDCDGQAGSVYHLLSAFTFQDTAHGVVRMEGVMDFMFPNSIQVPPFWHFEIGSCNNDGIEYSDARPATGCAGVTSTLCGVGGSACVGWMTEYLVGSGAGLPTNRAQLYFRNERSPSSPVTLASGRTHFGFEIRLLMTHAQAATCSGCSQVGMLTWGQAAFFDAAGTMIAQMTSTDPGSDATVNVNCPSCGIVSSRGTTWGLLKLLYR